MIHVVHKGFVSLRENVSEDSLWHTCSMTHMDERQHFPNKVPPAE